METQRIKFTAQSTTLALPEPAWHTNPSFAAAQNFWKLSPEQVFELLEAHQRFFDYFFGRQAVVEGGKPYRNATYEEWKARHEAAERVRYIIEGNLIARYRSELRERAERREQAKWRAKAKRRAAQPGRKCA